MKIALVLLAISIGFNIYFLQVETTVVDTFDEKLPEVDQVKVAQSSIAKCPTVKEKIIYKCNDKEPQKVVNDSVTTSKNEGILSDPEMVYHDFQQKWFDSVNEYLELDLRLPTDKISRYHELRSDREAELSQLLSQKIQEFVDENGENSSYPLSSEDTIALGKLNLKYEKALLDLFGIDQLKEYQKFKSDFNKKFQGTSMMVEF